MLKLSKVAIVFIGVSVYIKFFDRFSRSINKLLMPSVDKRFFVFTDNHINTGSPNVTCIKVPFQEPRHVKLHKFHFIASIVDQLEGFDVVFYFDADSVLEDLISEETVQGWFDDRCLLVGVLHPWHKIRALDKRFEANPISAAYVPECEWNNIEYHQSCFWAVSSSMVRLFLLTVRDMIRLDLARGHMNKHGICDEIYVNRFFITHHRILKSLPTEYANPGDEYERVTASPGRRGFRFPNPRIIVHDNAAQTKSWAYVSDELSFCRRKGVDVSRLYSDVVPDAANDYLLNDQCNAGQISLHPPNSEVGGACSNGVLLRSPLWRDSTSHLILVQLESICNQSTDVEWLVISGDAGVSDSRWIPQHAFSGRAVGAVISSELLKIVMECGGKSLQSLQVTRDCPSIKDCVINRGAFLQCMSVMSDASIELAVRADPKILDSPSLALGFLLQCNGYSIGLSPMYHE